MGQHEDECFGSQRREQRERREAMDWIGLFEFGFLIILIGTIFIATPNILDALVNFVKSFTANVEVFPGIFIPIPNTGDNTLVYRTAMYFCLAFGVFQIIVLILRFALKSPIEKKTGTVGSIVFWFGAAFLENMLAINGNSYWIFMLGGLIVLIGLSIIVRAIVRLLFR